MTEEVISCDICDEKFNSYQSKGGHMSTCHTEKEREEEYLDEIRRIGEIVDGSPRIRDVRSLSDYSQNTFTTFFESWNTALRKAGFETNLEINISDEELIEEIQKIAKQLEKTPTVDDMNEKGNFCTYTYKKRFGTWNKSLKKAGLEPEFPRNGVNVESVGEDWYNKRPQALERDDEQCRVCGMTLNEHVSKNGRGLEVHHITPRSTFKESDELEWSNVNNLNNLVTLCQNCHREYGDRCGTNPKWTDADVDEWVEKARSAHE